MFIFCEVVAAMLLLTLNDPVQTATIFGGWEAAPHSRPYMALLERDNPNCNCGGFLLNEDFVMTAAHCQAKVFTVQLGLHRYGKGNIQKIRVEQAFPHKDYNNVTYSNDIMLLKLSTKAKFSDTVKPISLTDWDNDSLPSSCMIAGWGPTNEHDIYMSPILREVNITLVHSYLCEGENSYCSEGEKRPAKGDSGGPLVCEDGKAFGVISSCTRLERSPIWCKYSKVQAYRWWIDFTIKNALKKV